MSLLGVDVPAKSQPKEPVLDVPAIDMTDGAKQAAVPRSSQRPTSLRRSRSKPAKAVPTRSARRSKAKLSPAGATRRDGSVGRQTFEAVERLVSQGAKKTEAFNQVAQDSGRSAATVANAYYRVAREAGSAARDGSPTRVVPSQKRSETTTGRRRAPSRRGTASPSGELDQLADNLVSTLGKLAEAVSLQSKELADLRGRLDNMRKAVS